MQKQRADKLVPNKEVGLKIVQGKLINNPVCVKQVGDQESPDVDRQQQLHAPGRSFYVGRLYGLGIVAHEKMLKNVCIAQKT